MQSHCKIGDVLQAEATIMAHRRGNLAARFLLIGENNNCWVHCGKGRRPLHIAGFSKSPLLGAFS